MSNLSESLTDSNSKSEQKKQAKREQAAQREMQVCVLGNAHSKLAYEFTYESSRSSFQISSQSSSLPRDYFILLYCIVLHALY